ncbi:MAG TPA: MBL fold metallo-hydrolase [Jiangellales bacterium]|nr:MBL fold metallo-hydrolase [Jiangellales bacterium]
MRLTVLGGCGAWPTADSACSGYLIEHDGYRLLVDPGYAVVPRLLRHLAPGDVDAVFVTHGHPDHCADLNPLLRARVMSDEGIPPLPVFAPPAALTAVLALDRRQWLGASVTWLEFTPGDDLAIGPFDAETRMLPHSLPNAGVRLSSGEHAIAYTGDTGPSTEIATLARDADLLLAEASYVDDDDMPDDLRTVLSTARQAGRHAAEANARRLVLTHIIPGTDPDAAAAAARASYPGDLSVATDGLVVDLGSSER